MNEQKKTELSLDELTDVTGGIKLMQELGCHAGALPLTAVTAYNGKIICNLCEMRPELAAKGVLNHLRITHGMTEQEAMAQIPENLKSIQWELPDVAAL